MIVEIVVLLLLIVLGIFLYRIEKEVETGVYLGIPTAIALVLAVVRYGLGVGIFANLIIVLGIVAGIFFFSISSKNLGGGDLFGGCFEIIGGVFYFAIGLGVGILVAFVVTEILPIDYEVQSSETMKLGDAERVIVLKEKRANEECYVVYKASNGDRMSLARELPADQTDVSQESKKQVEITHLQSRVKPAFREFAVRQKGTRADRYKLVIPEGTEIPK